MSIYQKLSCSTISLSIPRLMRSQSERNPEDNYRSNLESSLKESLGIENPTLQANHSDRNSSIDDSSQTSATILIVDDTPNNLQVLFSYLETAGFKVLLAENGTSALQIANSQIPDLILLDVLMPNIDGFETCSRLKAQVSTREIPVIFLTALSETVNKVRGFQVGGVDYITKPTQQEEVLARIQTHLNLQRMRHTLARQNKELQQTLDFEASVRRITDKTRDSLNENFCLQVATQELATVLNLGSCQVELYDFEQVTATIACEYNSTLPACQGETRQVGDFPELYQQLLQKYPLQLVEAIPQFNPQGIQVTRLACPIFDDRTIMGNLWGLRPPGEVFTPLEIRLMQQAASQCAIAIRQARLYADSNRQVAELAKLDKFKNDLFKIISHELKAPMSSIQLAAQTLENLLKTTKNPRKSLLFDRVFKIFNKSCQQQKQLMDDLLNICYADDRTKIIQPELFELNSWLSNLTQIYLERILDRQQELILDFSAEKINITADPIILERIIREFLENACKYTPAKGEIKIQTTIATSEISLCIINSGVEIFSEKQGLLGARINSLSNNKRIDIGLGLTLVEKLIEILNATIEVKKKNNKTTFCLKLPL
ncbi:response regulator [Waterburya agarophytonicola K14]|uniref:histidine kinase n=1 Tax=Waterburya agarophytonicola KI4 TaxID=2874699 RepID=A0A964FH13_9CYAN|nr:response regulator [Waterburya agarophytonicola]MCC0178676.1 response regulator [Waterburya agarophytonicola KI4]